MSIEEMKAELEAAGYQFLSAQKEDAAWVWVVEIRTPDGWRFPCEEYIDDLDHAKNEAMKAAIELAYPHLQKERRLVAHEKFFQYVTDVCNEDKQMGNVSGLRLLIMAFAKEIEGEL
jgi:hypothetical protein